MANGIETAENVVMLPVALLDDNPLNADIFITAEADDTLINSVKVHGIIEPLIVTPVNNRYRIVSGHRRKKACTITGLELVPCRIKTFLSDDHELLILFNTNINRDMKDAYKLRLYKPLKQLLRQITKNDATELLTGHIDSDDSASGAFDPKGVLEAILTGGKIPTGVRMADVVKVITGYSFYEQKVLTRVCDEEYRENTINVLRKIKKVKKGEPDRLLREWQQLENRIYTEELTIRQVDKEVNALVEQIAMLANPPAPKVKKVKETVEKVQTEVENIETQVAISDEQFAELYGFTLQKGEMKFVIYGEEEEQCVALHNRRGYVTLISYAWILSRIE
jgi:hypothetical protein